MKRYITMVVLLFVVAGLAFAVDSGDIGEFSATSPIWANWSNSYSPVVTLSNNTANCMVDIHNSTSNIKNSTFGAAPFYVSPNASNIALSGDTNRTIVFITSGLAPGRYSGIINISNSTNVSEYANVSATLDVPITFTNNVGSFSGNISNSTEVYYFNASDVAYAAGFNVTITGKTGDFTFTVYDNASAQIASKSTGGGTSLTWNVTSSGHAYPLEGIWRIEAANSTASAQFNATIELLQASLRVNNSFVSGSAPYSENIGYNKTFTYTFTLENQAGYDVNISQVLNSSDYLNKSNNYMEWTHNLTEGTNLSAGLSGPVELSITLDTSKTGNTQGTYRGWLFINTSTGYPYNTYNLSIEVALSNDLDVSVTNVKNDTDGTNVIKAGSWVNVTTVPKFENGTMVAGLYADNFSVSFSHVNISGCSMSASDVANKTESSSDYLVQAYVPSSGCGKNNAVVGGNYTVTVGATDLTGQNSGSGSWNDTVMVNDSALNVTALVPGSSEITSTTLDTSDTLDITPRIYNYGPQAATGVFVNHSVSGACSFTSGPNPIYIGDVSAWEMSGTINGSSAQWEFTMSSSPGTCSINLTGYASSGTWALWSRTVTITVQNASSGNGQQTGGDQTTGQTTGASNASTTPSIDLSIIGWPKHTAIVQGNSKSVDIKVKNSGSNAVQNVETKVEGIDSGWWEGTALTSLGSGTEYVLPVTFDIPENASVKNYSITFVASSPNATARASADLAVLPSENTKKIINETLVNLTNRYNELLKDLEDAAGKGFDVAGANSTLVEAKDLLDKAQGYADAGDWFNVNALLDQIESALNNAETKIGAVEKTVGLGLPELGAPTYLMVGAAVVVIAIGAVALWLTKRTEKGPKYSGFKIKRRPLHIGQKFSRLKEKLKKRKPKKKSAKSSYHYQAEMW